LGSAQYLFDPSAQVLIARSLSERQASGHCAHIAGSCSGANVALWAASSRMSHSNHCLIVGSLFTLCILVGACGSAGGARTGGGSAAGGTANGGGVSALGGAGAAGSSPASGGALGGNSAAGGNALGGAGALGGGSATGGSGGGGAGAVLPEGTPATVLLDGATLKQVQQALVGGGSPEQKAAFANLLAAANTALTSGTWSVTTKATSFVVNSDPHEYVSFSPYFWPPDATPPNDTGTFGKCPYVNHDGVRNPDVDKVTDRHGLHASSEAIFELALAWYFTGDTKYADQAERVARTWYLDPATAMNPSLAHAQSSGPCGTGTATGIIEASGGYLTDTLDGLAILALDTRDTGWSATDRAGITAWLGKFVTFLQTSTVGKAENAAANNHGTWYDAQLASIYLFTGDATNATALVSAARSKRIDPQIESDGRMPLELSRATSWHYANYDAAAFCRLAGVAKHVGVDLWAYTNPKGGSIAKAIAYLLPTATSQTPPGPWSQYNDITEPFDAGYQAEAYYSLHALADYGNDAAAKALFSQTPVPVLVPGHYCAGDRFPLGSDFCAITPLAAPFSDLQPTGTPAVDMWPLIPTCRVPIN
jgi:hypothetical protein